MKYTPEAVRVFKTADEIRTRVSELGKQISNDYKQRGNTLVVVGILKGSFIFIADLVRSIEEKVPVTVDFVRLSSYGDKTISSGDVRMELDLTQPISGKDVLVIDDIVDTGRTMDAFVRLLRERHPASIRVCALLRKPARTVIPVHIDYVGFTIPDYFAVGYGMDYRGEYRHLPYIGILGEGKIWQ